MKQISFLFVTGDSWLDLLVTKVTRSRWSHVALRFDDDQILVEALAGRGVRVESGDRYENWPRNVEVSGFVTNAAYEAMRLQAEQWVEQEVTYGYLTCLSIGIKELFGLQAAKASLHLKRNSRRTTLVCSEMAVILWRLTDPGFFSGRDPELVSPDELYKILLSEAGCKIDKQEDCAYNC